MTRNTMSSENSVSQLRQWWDWEVWEACEINKWDLCGNCETWSLWEAQVEFWRLNGRVVIWLSGRERRRDLRESLLVRDEEVAAGVPPRRPSCNHARISRIL